MQTGVRYKLRVLGYCLEILLAGRVWMMVVSQLLHHLNNITLLLDIWGFAIKDQEIKFLFFLYIFYKAHLVQVNLK